ncbi:MAG: hypothetical protein IJT65_04575 [Eubacterium sp.]|nr:hypothetical protein [Eubacterium sp.]
MKKALKIVAFLLVIVLIGGTALMIRYRREIHDYMYFRPEVFSTVTDTFVGDYYYEEANKMHLLHIDKDGTVSETVDFTLTYTDQKASTDYYKLVSANGNYYYVTEEYLNSNEKTPGASDIHGIKESGDGLDIYPDEDFEYGFNHYSRGIPSYSHRNFSGGRSSKSDRYSYNSEDEFGDAVQNYMDDYFEEHPENDPGYDW